MVERICSSCKRSNLRRSARHGFMETFVYSLFGMYPWRCRQCGIRTMLRDRGESRHGHRPTQASGRV
ncbi:hypothetical protein [Terriglobus sp.]|uniref:hypothetical protein n=1 Tax=Terriglobus sp. TaxID=1889013 RepID=UPI003B005B2C